MALIRADLEIRDVRPWRPTAESVAEAPPPAADPERLALENALLERTAELARVRAEALKAAEAHLAALRDVEAKARAAGRLEVEADAAASLELLRAGLQEAVARLALDRAAIEALAIALASEALGRVFADPEGRAAMVTDIIRRQLELLSAQAVLLIQVSSADFSNEADLSALAGATGIGTAQIQASAQLSPGDCRMKLRLGELDAGLGRQWGRLQDTLGELFGQTAP